MIEQKTGGSVPGRMTLAAKIARLTVAGSPPTTPIPELSLYRREAPSEPTSYLHGPSICLIAQGSKRVILGEESYTYDAQNFLLTSVGLPVVAQVIEASTDRPYLGLSLKLDPGKIAQLSWMPTCRHHRSGRPAGE